MLEIITVDPQQPDAGAIARAAQVLRSGGLVAFPTETVYGLGVDAFQTAAVRRLFAVKGRPAYDPLIVHLAAPAELSRVASEVPPVARRLAEAFWPGPLSLVVPRLPELPTEVTAGLDTVAVRAPSHPVALALLRTADRPIAAPSANLFGHVSPTTAAHVLADLGQRIDLLLDAGPTPIGIESTVVDCTVDPPLILRPGGLSLERLATAVPSIRLATAATEPDEQVSATHQPTAKAAAHAEHKVGHRAPGQTPRHYAPRARVVLIRGPASAVAWVLCQAAQRLVSCGRGPVGLVVSGDRPSITADQPQGVLLRPLARPGALEAAGRALYATLRELDQAGADVILASALAPQGLGLAINDRLARAAAGRIVDVGDDPEAAVAAVIRHATAGDQAV